YKTHISASFNPKNIKSTSDAMSYPGYYFQVEFGSLWMGGGAYFLDKEPLRKVRTAIAQDSEAFRDLLNAADFKQHYGEIKGEQNKVLPPEFKEASKSEPLLANKQFYYMAEMDPENALRADFPEFVAGYFRAGKPLNDYFRSAIGL